MCLHYVLKLKLHSSESAASAAFAPGLELLPTEVAAGRWIVLALADGDGDGQLTREDWVSR